MSAILGRVAFDGRPVDEALFARAFEALRPARCARSDSVTRGPVGLGHHDSGLEAAYPQPVSEGSCTIIADARIYNREALARALDLPAGSLSDAALILQAYLRWQEDCLHHINGDFGVAIHDSARGEVFLARDHIGVRPLFWTMRGAEVLFASFLQGLVGFSDLDWHLDERRIARFLRNPYGFEPKSFVAGVEAVEPGHWVRLRADEVTRQRWWDPAKVPQRRDIKLDEALREVRALTEEAVRARLPGNMPAGAHFSGGIDSTLVTFIAAQILQAQGSNLAGAYAWCPPVDAHYPDMGEGDERRVINAHCTSLGVPARFGAANGASFDALIDRPMELEGTADLMDELPIIAQAEADGLGVMLSGWGGDELFSSHANGHIAWMFRTGRLRKVMGVMRRHGGGLRRPRRTARLFWRTALVPMLPGPLYDRFTPYQPLYGDGVFPSEEMRAMAGAPDSTRSVRLRPDALSYARALLLNGHIGERMATWAAWSEQAGFEYRYPLTDRHLLEFLLSLPQELQFGEGSGRHMARRAFADLLPEGLKKEDIANETLRADNRVAWMKRVVEDAARGRFETTCPWLDMEAFDQALHAAPAEAAREDVRGFAKLFVAARVYRLYKRCQAPDAALRPPASGS